MLQTVQIAAIAPITQAEGPGRRFAIWFQGCPLRCPGCCNPEYLPFHGGTTRSLDSLLQELRKSREQNKLDGITLLGGEPFAHAKAAAPLAIAARELGLSVMVFSGYHLEQLQTRIDSHTAELLAHIDILVDGPYDRTQPETSRRWIGSRNQSIHFLSERHHPDEACWKQANTLEIRVRGQDIVVNGFPAEGTEGLWKGWKRKVRLS